jgi:hypothetical protein
MPRRTADLDLTDGRRLRLCIPKYSHGHERRLQRYCYHLIACLNFPLPIMTRCLRQSMPQTTNSRTVNLLFVHADTRSRQRRFKTAFCCPFRHDVTLVKCHQG